MTVKRIRSKPMILAVLLLAACLDPAAMAAGPLIPDPTL
jgi:hypothetical protein